MLQRKLPPSPRTAERAWTCHSVAHLRLFYIREDRSRDIYPSLKREREGGWVRTFRCQRRPACSLRTTKAYVLRQVFVFVFMLVLVLVQVFVFVCVCLRVVCTRYTGCEVYLAQRWTSPRGSKSSMASQRFFSGRAAFLCSPVHRAALYNPNAVQGSLHQPFSPVKQLARTSRAHRTWRQSTELS